MSANATASKQIRQGIKDLSEALVVLDDGSIRLSDGIDQTASGTQQEHVTHCWCNDVLIFKSHASSVHQGLVGIPMLDIKLSVAADDTPKPAPDG
jgi:hypothetical protein